MIQKLLNREAKMSVVGLGYVGLPIALEFARKMPVIGFDIREDRIEMMKNHIDPSEELTGLDFLDTDILFTANPEDLRQASFHIIAVPTPIDKHNMPDLKPLLAATRTVGKVLKKGDYVVYESTVYPGCTEEDCVPLLEELSGLKYIEDFKVGFSPERINPGDKVHTLTSIVKVTAGCDKESSEVIAQAYELIVEAGVHRASSIMVAEAAKIIENTQRDVNIAFMNELSIIFNRMGINTYEVLKAAGTKWNFLNFYPGLVGGHCIGVDPYYLAFKAREFRYHPQIINAGRFINDSMGFYVAKQLVKKLIAANKKITNSRVLVMGTTFKENVSDLRNSRIPDIINELGSYGVAVDAIDPYADIEEFMHEYGIQLLDPEDGLPYNYYDAIIVAVSHVPYTNLDLNFFKMHLNRKGILVDLKGIYRSYARKLPYWSL
jgi:UDP-N-acetyl-D-glucosamine/UDP-N-acetyl-D-galactosamine dehydrogenase